MMFWRACNMATSVLCPPLVKDPPWLLFTSTPCTSCKLQIPLIAGGSVVFGWAVSVTVVTHMVYPCAGHNLKRAFQKSLLLHAVIYFMLFIFSAHLLLGANNMRKSSPESLCADVLLMRLHN